MRRLLPAAVIVAAAWIAALTSSDPLPAPAQPIEFSHLAHVQTDHLECELCHSGVRRSAFAEIAPVERCMGCHRYVLPQNPEVAKLRRIWDAGQPIRWVRVYALPQFVRFNHAAHTVAGVGCDICHGEVAAMRRVARVVEPTMGWCVRCHRERGASDECLTCHY